jgi:hypothetical protein
LRKLDEQIGCRQRCPGSIRKSACSGVMVSEQSQLMSFTQSSTVVAR